MSVTDVLSPMSVDRSIIEVVNISGDCGAQGVEPKVKELPPRNDRQRFFEVVQYQMDILDNFRESEVS